MSRVECQVSNCQHFLNYLCSLEKINVEGPGAKSKTQTCCLSFEEKQPGMENSVGNMNASSETGIHCDASNCAFNSNCHCDATDVHVGCSNNCATSKSGTACLSFVQR
jgi:Domain of Unknown Function (DUF1540).